MNLTDLRLDPAAAFEIVAWSDRLGGISALRTRGRLVDASAHPGRWQGFQATGLHALQPVR